jgi:hypothetical protein
MRVVSIANASGGPARCRGAVTMVIGCLLILGEDVSVFFALRNCQENEVFGPPCINISAYTGGIYCKRKRWTNTSPWCSSFCSRWLNFFMRYYFLLTGIVQFQEYEVLVHRV